MSLLGRSVFLTRLRGILQCTSRSLHVNQKVVQSTCATPHIFLQHPDNPWMYNEHHKIKSPADKVNSFRLPNGLIWLPLVDPPTSPHETQIDEPASNSRNTEKQAARLIVIRRKKMKKHKLRKLRKRMKFESAKIRQRRELKKEKEFQAVLISQCKEAEAFSAEKYVQERLNKLHTLIEEERLREERSKISTSRIIKEIKERNAALELEKK